MINCILNFYFGIRINNRLAFLMADSQRGDYPPTNQSLEFFEEIKIELNVELNNLKMVSKKYIDSINSLISDSGIKFINK